MTPTSDRLASLAHALPKRPDYPRVLARLARAFMEHKAQLWPGGVDMATDEAIALPENTFAIVTMLALLFREAEGPSEGPYGTSSAYQWLARNAWVDALLNEIERGPVRLDG